MNDIKEFKIKNSKGQILNVCEGKDVDNLKGVIIYLHGIGAHHQEIFDCEDSFQYKSSFFALSGYKSYGLEFSGHGKSEGLRCSIDNYLDLVDEIKLLILYLKGIHDNTKFFIYSESMGAGLSIVYQIINSKESFIDGYVLMSAMCGITDKIKPNYFVKEILFKMSYVYPTLPFLGATDHIAASCRNEDYLKHKLSCKYQYNEKVRLNTARECYLVCEYIEKNKDKFDVPVFILHGIDDTITDAKKSISFYKSVKNDKKRIYLTKDSNHILTLGINREDDRPLEILKKIVSFFDDLCD